MAEEISLSLEETNKLRIQLGLKPIVQSGSGATNGNKQKLPESQIEQENKNIKFIDKNKINNIRKRLNKVSQRIILDSNEEPHTNGGWLNKVGTQNRKHAVNISFDEEVEDDEDATMPILKLSHKLGELQKGKDIILTLKDKNINDDKSDDDVLEDETLSTFKENSKNLKLKDMNKERRRKKYSLNVSSKDLEDHHSDMEEPGSILRINAITTASAEIEDEKRISDNDEHTNKIKVRFSDNESDDEPDSGDFKVAKIKKRKIKDGRSIKKRRKVELPLSIKGVILEDEDGDEDDILNIKVNNTTGNRKEEQFKPTDDITYNIKKEALENRRREMEVRKLRDNNKSSSKSDALVIDESASFLSNLNSKLIVYDEDKESTNAGSIFEEDKLQKTTPDDYLGPTSSSITDDKNQNDTNNNQGLTFSSGLATTLHFLQDRKILPKKDDINNDVNNSSNDEPLKLKKKIEQRKLDEERENKDDADASIQKGKRVVSSIQSQLLKDYNPEINLVYKDDNGNELTTKEAYKKLSQRFHGTKSNKRKQAKFNERVQQRNKQKGSAMQSNFFESLLNKKEGA
ncbi:similar to Saccharomyces cerevisiae YOR308C SNU66 Component of the U4/U6.U5 snRNP complex involved in pre-mRNA splicing via spliceosome [Maudiozyma saulgeensis]|uniref:Similar to Saccharomyces cerevisiae YOR308C SNU66 Component of the U4/U6.U5 snRNP complex involved in pre-mRNA splicing via spliceosome n=1 Tax=Maudiozyma saulgeensis TaxID=1789683 RepID=A0A1X7R499_9SACH|nr:similar to Saccharomyces cerevisiae YOR308C SNU66 Component of the U4/U6.U5 snRNP complex involved in pre-mRNA splicing via spliceosome [Kazachstania saulgeensis]